MNVQTKRESTPDGIERLDLTAPDPSRAPTIEMSPELAKALAEASMEIE